MSQIPDINDNKLWISGASLFERDAGKLDIQVVEIGAGDDSARRNQKAHPSQCSYRKTEQYETGTTQTLPGLVIENADRSSLQTEGLR